MTFAIRKSNLQQFPCRSEAVCRIEEGNTNKYLKEPRKIEEFLRTIEPKYNMALNNLRKKEIDVDTIYVVSGFVCYVQSISPAGMRIHSAPLRAQVEATAKILDTQGKIPRAPDVLQGKSISELIEDGAAYVDVDGKYPPSPRGQYVF